MMNVVVNPPPPMKRSTDLTAAADSARQTLHELISTDKETSQWCRKLVGASEAVQTGRASYRSVHDQQTAALRPHPSRYAPPVSRLSRFASPRALVNTSRDVSFMHIAKPLLPRRPSTHIDNAGQSVPTLDLGGSNMRMRVMAGRRAGRIKVYSSRKRNRSPSECGDDNAESLQVGGEGQRRVSTQRKRVPLKSKHRVMTPRFIRTLEELADKEDGLSAHAPRRTRMMEWQNATLLSRGRSHITERQHRRRRDRTAMLGHQAPRTRYEVLAQHAQRPLVRPARLRKPVASSAFRDACDGSGVRCHTSLRRGLGQFNSRIDDKTAEILVNLHSFHNASKRMWRTDTNRWMEQRQLEVQPELSREQYMMMRRLFRTLDADDSGRLDRDELIMALQLSGLKRNTERTVDLMMRAMGKEPDGELNFAEFCRMLMSSSGGLSGTAEQSGQNNVGRDIAMNLLSFKRKRLLESTIHSTSDDVSD